jgi:hypothetical protein
MNRHEALYALLLRAYPAAFRARYGREMALAFRDLRREEKARGLRFWAPLLWDAARSAPGLHFDAWRERWVADIQTTEGTMRPMAILAVLIGALESLNALAEAWAGGMVNRDSESLIVGVAGAAAGVTLMITGVALLRRSPRAIVWAWASAYICVTLFGLNAVLFPRLSVLSTLLGVGLPIALLIYLHIGRGRPGATIV